MLKKFLGSGEKMATVTNNQLSNSVTIRISKDEVDKMDFTGIEAAFSSMSENKELRRKYKSACSFCFHGYDDDPREIIEIPEVMRWLNESIQLNIPWFYFLRTTIDSGLYLLMCAYATPISQTSKDYSILAEFDIDSSADFLRVIFHNLNTYMGEHGISEKVNRELSEQLIQFYFKDFLQ